MDIHFLGSFSSTREDGREQRCKNALEKHAKLSNTKEEPSILHSLPDNVVG